MQSEEFTTDDGLDIYATSVKRNQLKVKSEFCGGKETPELSMTVRRNSEVGGKRTLSSCLEVDKESQERTILSCNKEMSSDVSIIKKILELGNNNSRTSHQQEAFRKLSEHTSKKRVYPFDVGSDISIKQIPEISHTEFKSTGVNNNLKIEVTRGIKEEKNSLLELAKLTEGISEVTNVKSQELLRAIKKTKLDLSPTRLNLDPKKRNPVPIAACRDAIQSNASDSIKSEGVDKKSGKGEQDLDFISPEFLEVDISTPNLNDESETLVFEDSDSDEIGDGDEEVHCNSCDVVVYKMSDLRRHVMFEHSEDLNNLHPTHMLDGNILAYLCWQCEYRANDKYAITRHHREVHIKIRDFHCDICGHQSSRLGLLKHHIKLAHEKRKDFKCDQCNFETGTKAHLRHHVMGVHEKIQKFKCEQCDYTAAISSHLSQHIKVVHDKVRNFPCDQCDYKAVSNCTLKEHVAAVHEKRRDFNCPQCGKSFGARSTLRQHLKNVHKVNAQVFQCDRCEYNSSSRRVLTIHILSVHEKRKDYRCNLCPYENVTNSGLRRHIKTVHENVRNIQCPHCTYKTASKSSLKVHIQSIHEKRRDYCCKQCDYKASTNATLNVHIKLKHQEKNSFQCPNCEYSAPSKTTLRRHCELVHKVQKELSCHLCSYKTALNSSLKKHVWGVHEKNKILPK